MKKIKNEKGYVDLELIGGIIFIVIVLSIIVFFIAAIFGNLCLDFAAGSHRITPTAVDTDIWGNYKVYYKTSEYTQNSQEDYYYIKKEDTELAEQMKEYVSEGKEVVVYYDEWVGFKGFTNPSEAPITKIEVIEKESNENEIPNESKEAI